MLDAEADADILASTRQARPSSASRQARPRPRTKFWLRKKPSLNYDLTFRPIQNNVIRCIAEAIILVMKPGTSISAKFRLVGYCDLEVFTSLMLKAII